MVTSRAMLLTVVLMAGMVLLGSACMAADALVVGIVDIVKVGQEAPRVKQLRESLDRTRLDLSNKLSIRSQNLLLPDEQIKELVDLKQKPAPTEADKARIKVLTDQERANDDELKKLQATPQLTDDQKKRMNELADLKKKAQETYEQMEKDYNARFQNEGADMERKAIAEIEDVIKKVAAEKKYTFVFAKDAVFFGGTDITSDVIGKLDRKPE